MIHITIEVENERYLKTVGIYGANGSGKSNVIKGLNVLHRLVKNSLNTESLSRMLANTFLLQEGKESEDSFFQIIIFLGDKRLRYGFTLSKEGYFNNEWLFGPAEKNETCYFKRHGKDVVCNPEWFHEGLNLPLEKLRNNALFLSFCSSYDGATAKLLKDYISEKIVIEGRSPAGNSAVIRGGASGDVRISKNCTNELLEKGHKQLVLEYLREAGLGYEDVALQKSGLEEDFVRTRVLFLKNVFDEEGNITRKRTFGLNSDESAGTQKFYFYIGILHERFINGGLYVSDEIDSNFHPSLLMRLIKLFNNTIINKAGAQLLFTTHDTNLMQPTLLRRDQIYFTEKSTLDDTRLYSLSDLKGIRNNADFARQYLAGFYGALPLLGNLMDKEVDNNLTPVF